MSEPITQEKAQEYREIASLVCLDLDILLDCCGQKGMDADALRKQIKHMHEMKESLINDPVVRRDRFEAASFVLSLPIGAARFIFSLPVEESHDRRATDMDHEDAGKEPATNL